MSPQRAKAVHTVDEAMTQLIDQIKADWVAAAKQLETLAKWKKSTPLNYSGPTAKQIVWLAWLAMSDAALRASEDEGEHQCVS